MAAIGIPLHQPGRSRAGWAGRTTDGRVRRVQPIAVAAPVVAKPSPTAADYKRRQLVAFAIAILLAIVALSAARAAIGGPGAEPLTGPRSAGGTMAPQPIARSVYVVQPGDTLWKIARALQPEGDVRPLVGRIADQRGGAPLQVGERIALP